MGHRPRLRLRARLRSGSPGGVCGGVLIRSGGDLLSRTLRCSTIGGAALNGRVRDGIGCIPAPMAAGPDQDPPDARARPPAGGRGPLGPWRVAVRSKPRGECPTSSGTGGLSALPVAGSDPAYRTISTGQLSALPRVHPRPIDVVVFHGPQGRPRLEGGFPLRCLQRLSRPFIATRHCCWRNNRSTSGTFTPVLSY